MNICFHIHPFRDRDFWPMARTALAASHTLYYGIVGRTSFPEIIAQDGKVPFDLVISADRVSFESPGDPLHLRLKKKPPLLEVIFNGLIEIVEGHRGRNGGFDHLEEQRITLGIMDPELLSVCAAIGLRHTVLVPYGVPRFRFAQPDFFIRRLARRAYGVLTPADLQREKGRYRFLSQILHRLAGNATKRKSVDMVFLGECKLATNPPLLESIRARYFPGQSPAWLATLDGRARAEFDASPPRTAGDVAMLTGDFLKSVQDHPQTRIGKALIAEHILHQFRTARRLRYVRHLQAAFGRRFWLYGDDFRRLGLDARPSSHDATETKFLRAKIAMDFGSNSYAASLYTRPVRIIYCDALLLQLRQPDARDVFGKLASEMTFSSPEEMVALVSSFLNARHLRESTSAALRELGTTAVGMDHALATVFDALNLKAGSV